MSLHHRRWTDANVLSSHHLECPDHILLPAESSQRQYGLYMPPDVEVSCHSTNTQTTLPLFIYILDLISCHDWNHITHLSGGYFGPFIDELDHMIGSALVRGYEETLGECSHRWSILLAHELHKTLERGGMLRVSRNESLGRGMTWMWDHRCPARGGIWPSCPVLGPGREREACQNGSNKEHGEVREDEMEDHIFSAVMVMSFFQVNLEVSITPFPSMKENVIEVL